MPTRVDHADRARLAAQRIVDSGLDVFAHNIETVERLQVCAEWQPCQPWRWTESWGRSRVGATSLRVWPA